MSNHHHDHYIPTSLHELREQAQDQRERTAMKAVCVLVWVLVVLATWVTR